MNRTDSFTIQGAEECKRNLALLPLKLHKPLLMRVMRKAIEPMAGRVRSKAPYLWGDLKENLHVGTRLTRRQASFDRKEDDIMTAKLHFGTADPAGMMNEFGLANNPPQPFFRSEWEASKWQILAAIGLMLGPAVTKGVKTQRRKGNIP